VDITGGEPLVRTDFEEIVRELSNYDIEIGTLFTNASLLMEETLQMMLAHHQRPTVQISFDGLGHHDWLRGIDGAESQVDAALHLLRKYDFPTVAAMCIHKGNKDSIRATANYLAGLGVHALRLNAPQELGRAEVASGFNVILHATDHTLDTGYEGVHNELAWWHSELPNTPVIGIAEPDPISNPGLSNYVDNVFTVDKDGFRIAILNHTVGVVDTDRSVVSALDEAKVRADVEKARSLGAEMVVACPHWGHEGVPEVTEEQRKFARLYADLGVDVICGTNPRTLQPVEVLYGSDNHKTVCFYSLGCLVSSLNHENFLGGIAEYTLERMDGGRCRVRSAVLKPVVTRRAEREAYTIYFLSDYSDELAAIGWDNVSKETFQQMCTDILGSGYDRATCTYKVDLGIPEDAAPQQEAPAEQAPVEEAPAEPAPAEQAPAPAEEVPAEEAPVEEAA
jgi:hypothetical protein